MYIRIRIDRERERGEKEATCARGAIRPFFSCVCLCSLNGGNLHGAGGGREEGRDVHRPRRVDGPGEDLPSLCPRPSRRPVAHRDQEQAGVSRGGEGDSLPRVRVARLARTGQHRRSAAALPRRLRDGRRLAGPVHRAHHQEGGPCDDT